MQNKFSVMTEAINSRKGREDEPRIRQGSPQRPVFEVPFRELIQGKPFSVRLPYEGGYPEDKGTWKIEVRPAPQNK